MKNKKEFGRMIKFTLFSISAGAIQLGLFELLYNVFKWAWWPSYLIALIASVVWNFTLNREYTFKSSNNVPVAMTKVFIFYLIFTPLSTLLGNYLEGTLGWNGTVVTLINMVLNFILEYLYDRFYVFKDSIDTKNKDKKKSSK